VFSLDLDQFYDNIWLIKGSPLKTKTGIMCFIYDFMMAKNIDLGTEW